MATSGSVDFSVTRDDIIDGALRLLWISTPTAQETTDAAQALNMLVKQWQGQADFAPGLKVWSRKRATVFLEKNKYQYTLGPNGDHATNSYVETAVKVAASATDTTVDVDSITGISDGDYIGILLDDGTAHWTTVNGTPSGDTITITTAFPSAAAIDKAVFTYTTKMPNPLNILRVTRRDSSGDDTPLSPMSLDYYEDIPDKDYAGTPISYYPEYGRTDTDLFLDVAIDDVTDIIRITYLRPIEDLDSATDDLDYPQHWFRALKYNLAVDLAPEFRVEVPGTVASLAAQSLAIAQNWHPETSEVYFQPDL